MNWWLNLWVVFCFTLVGSYCWLWVIVVCAVRLLSMTLLCGLTGVLICLLILVNCFVA